MKCYMCNGDINDKANFCKHCGKPVNRLFDYSLFCVKCGVKNKTSSKYCSMCGAKIECEIRIEPYKNA